MATGVYGTNKLANVSPSDVDIFYTYTPGRDLPPTIGEHKLNAEQVLSRCNSQDQNPDGSIPL